MTISAGNRFYTFKLRSTHNKEQFETNNVQNIYSKQIENISKQIRKNFRKPKFPSIGIKELELNTFLLEKWYNFKSQK